MCFSYLLASFIIMVTNDCFPYFSFQLSNGVTLIGTPSENWAWLVMRRTLLLSIASCQCLIYRRVVWSPAISSWQNRQKIMLYYWAVTTPPCLQTSAKDLKLKYVDQYNSSLLCHSFINSSSTKNLLAHHFVHSLWAEMLMTCCWCVSLKHVNVFWLVWSVYKPFNLHISCGFLFIGLKGAYRLVSSPTLPRLTVLSTLKPLSGVVKGPKESASIGIMRKWLDGMIYCPITRIFWSSFCFVVILLQEQPMDLCVQICFTCGSSLCSVCVWWNMECYMFEQVNDQWLSDR